MTTKTDEQERAAFEAWASDEGKFPHLLERVDDYYRFTSTQYYWAGWQARAALQSQDREDAERFRWLTEDHTDAETRTRCREILARMAVMSYSAACVAIDHARRIES